MRLSLEELRAAWQFVRRGGRGPGLDGVTRERFTAHLDAELLALREQLRTGCYVPRAYRVVQFPKPGGGTRVLQIAGFRDRVVQRALLARLEPAVERISLPTSFAYRPGIGVREAVRAVCRARAGGFHEVFEGDVRACFDSIAFDLVADRLARLGLDTELIDLILECIAVGGPGLSPFSDVRGLPQGAVLSPTLCNLILTDLDRHMDRKHRRLVRYADDFLVLCRSERACLAAMAEVEEGLAAIGLELNPAKSALSDFGLGFDFLGARFVGSFVISHSAPPYGRKKNLSRRRRTVRKLEYIF